MAMWFIRVYLIHHSLDDSSSSKQSGIILFFKGLYDSKTRTSTVVLFAQAEEGDLYFQ